MRILAVIALLALSGASAYADDSKQEGGRRVATPTEVCKIISNSYRQALDGVPHIPQTKNQIHDDLVSISATIARHETLSRLLTIAWAQQCDLGTILDAERARINRVYPQLQAQ